MSKRQFVAICLIFVVFGFWFTYNLTSGSTEPSKKRSTGIHVRTESQFVHHGGGIYSATILSDQLGSELVVFRKENPTIFISDTIIRPGKNGSNYILVILITDYAEFVL